MKDHSVFGYFRRARRDVELEHFTFHDFRHGAASQMINNGVSLNTVGKVLGHLSPVSTQRYAHLNIATLRDAEKPSVRNSLRSNLLGIPTSSFLSNKNRGNVRFLHTTKENADLKKPLRTAWILVAGAGIEPATRGFSIRCSTD